MTRYFLGVLEERNGEYEYQIPIRFTAASEQVAAEALTRSAENWYGNYSQKDGDRYYFHSGEVCVQAGEYKEIPKSTYTELNGFIVEAL